MQSGFGYTPIDSAYPYIIRGTNQQTQTGLLWTPPTYKSYGHGAVAQTTQYTAGMQLGKYALHNRSAAAIVMGIGVRIPNYLWKAGSWVNATTTYADDTTDAQDTDTNDFPLETTTVNDGFVILSRVKFNAVSINVSTASVDAGTVARAVRFSDSAGSAWASAPANLFQQTGAATNYATGENVIAFAPPIDWGKSSALATDLPDGYYAMNVRATDEPATTAGLAKAIEIFRIYELQEAVADNSTLYDDFIAGDLLMAQDDSLGLYGDALVAFFGTANAQNRVTAMVRAA